MKQTLLKILFSAFALAIFSSGAWAQSSTTSGMSGIITDENGDGLPGATVIAIHTPSGSQYGSTTEFSGYFRLNNMRVGGPYEIVVSYIGYASHKRDNITLQLGQTFNLDVKMREDLATLEEVVIIAENEGIFDGNKTGASMNISNERIQTLPTISRNINDFTRLTPQSNGTSFAGRDNRFNNYTIDGNIYNNNFGLGSGQFAGSNPISLDVIEEVQVNIAPFDVRQGGFTGASVNAITKSGTNNFEGSVYYYIRNDQLIGDKVGETRLSRADAKNEIQGVRFGGPIIKDKLFFFVSYEKEEEAVPSFNKVASRPGLAPDGLTVSRVPADRLDFVRQGLIDNYGYDPGAYEGYSFASEQTRFNMRLDYNINRNHKVSVRYNAYDAFTDIPTNGNSIRFISERFRNTDRTGIEAMNFRNANYTMDRNVKSYVAELNSVLSGNVSNQLNIGYTSITDPKRGIPGGQDFPFVEVLETDGGGNDLYYFSVGNELYSVGNLLENNIFNITNNVSVFKGKHTYTFGVNYEHMTFDNAFNPSFNGFYRYGSYDDFVSAVILQDPTVQPLAFAQSFAFDGSLEPPTDATKFSQLGLYAQDEFQIKRNLKITGGLRIDLPFYPIDLPSNPNLDALNKEYALPNGSTFRPDVATLPKLRPLWSPRVGVNWDVKGDKTVQVRGGTGIFSGRIPFVWLSNQVNGNGVIRGGYGLERSRTLNPGDPGYVNDFNDDPRPFSDDIHAYRPTGGEAELSNELNITDPDFKLPQTWRTNAAVDYALPFGIIGTVETIYSKDISTPIAYNPVVRDPDGILNGPDKRPYWNGNYSGDPDFRNVFVLTNAEKQGDYVSLTLKLEKQFESGWYTTIAYTKSRARDYGLGDGSQASSLWSSEVSVDRNNPDISYTRFDQPNRVVGLMSYQKNGSILSLFYTGGEAGRFSYAYSGNFGDASSRLMYIPNTASELNLVDITVAGNVVTAQEQAAILDAYIAQDDYLSENRGSVAERNGAKLPWVHRFDFRIAQDIALYKQNKLQLSIDILNIGNLLNSEWGVNRTPFQRTLLNYRGRNAQDEPLYNVNLISGTTDFPTETDRFITDVSQTWSAQFGVRYIFGN